MKLEISIRTAACGQVFGLFTEAVAQLQQEPFDGAMTDGALIDLGKFPGYFFGSLTDPEYTFIGRATRFYRVYIAN